MRGSGLLTGGRVVSLLLNLVVHTVVIRALTKEDYGAFAYGLSAASILGSAVLLGLDKAVGRFVALYQERGEERKALGTVLLAIGVVLGVGLAAVAAVYALRHELLGSVVQSPEVLSLLLVLIVLAPLEALDSLLESVTAVFLGARAIFVRRHLVGPGLKLGAVLLVVATSGDAYLLAHAYIVGALIGIGLYLAILGRAWRRAAVPRVSPGELEYPVRAVLGYSMPLVVSEVLALSTGSLAVVFLEYFHAPDAVAEFRSVLPIARLNIVVLQSFAVLFIPFASRLFARRDHEGINELYWRTACWVAVLTFPVFVMTCAFASPLAALLFGPQYVTSGPHLAIMAFGFYFNAALGFNTYTFRVCGPVRSLVAIEVAATVLGVGGSLLLIQRFGALGAALGTALILVLRNLFTHVGLVTAGTGVRLLDGRFVPVYLLIAATATVLVWAQRALVLSIPAGIVVVGLASAALFYVCRRKLELPQTFPELLRVPLLGRLLAGPDASRGDAAADADPRAPLLTAHLQEHAGRYVGEAADAPARVRLVRVDRRSVSWLYRFDVDVGDRHETMLVKVPMANATRKRAEARGLPDRPRRASGVDPATKAELEHLALGAIHEHFTRVADARLGAVRVFDYLPDVRAVVMEFVGEPNLRRLVMHPWQAGGQGTVQALRPVFGNVGAWLRRYHALPAQPHVLQRHGDRAAFVVHVAAVADFLGRGTGDAAYFARVARRVEKLAAAALPASLPLGRAHGDFAMRNLLVAPTARVTGLDTLGRFSTAIYEDLGYFVADLKCNPVHALGWMSHLGRRRIAAFERAFLGGYFADEPVPVRAVALYEVQSLLDRWASLVLRSNRAAGVRTRLARRVQSFAMARLYRSLIREGLRVAAGGDGRAVGPHV